MGMKRVAITGCGGSAGMNFIRSLRCTPEKIYIVGTDSSKYYIKLSKADVDYLVPSCDKPGYLNRMNEIIIKEKVDFVHCQPDPEVRFISDHRDNLAANVFLPDKETIDVAQDKYRTYMAMQINEVPHPETEWVINYPNLLNIFARKEGKRWIRVTHGAGSLAALPVTSAEQAKMWIEYWITKGLTWWDFAISEFLPGKEYAFQSLWKDGVLITSAARQRIEYLFQNRMPSGQSSTPTVAKSVHNEQVNDIATRAVKAITDNANGIFCVDLKENEAGIPCVMEINAGRFFTTSLFFTKAGSNMPYIYLKLAYGEEARGLPQYNAVPKDLYYLRQIDCGEIMVREEEL